VSREDGEGPHNAHDCGGTRSGSWKAAPRTSASRIFRAPSLSFASLRRLRMTPLGIARVFSYFALSASLFMFASPASKSFPTILSMLMKTCITLAMNWFGPYMAQVTLVVSPERSSVYSVVL
jgi:hypothetical protein